MKTPRQKIDPLTLIFSVLLVVTALSIYHYRSERLIAEVSCQDGQLTAVVVAKRQSWVPEGFDVRVRIRSHEGNEVFDQLVDGVDIISDAKQIANEIEWVGHDLYRSSRLLYSETPIGSESNQASEVTANAAPPL